LGLTSFSYAESKPTKGAEGIINSEVTNSCFKPKSKYVLKCPNTKCNAEIPAHRKRTVRSACGKCCNTYNNGRFSEDYVMVLKENH
jgi:hypothetical protein